MVFCIVSIRLFVAGVASIRAATSLPRARRPPFIEFGLLAIGLPLASAHPLLVAARRKRKS
ncbi:MAG: hypothetical protein DMF84_06395 [Acidobacteria bacterium]|nr:MAG: hypothetical protein DMF84_06395 [Acidobacteriota bacterium]